MAEILPIRRKPLSNQSTNRDRPEHCIYSAFSYASHSRNVHHDNFRLVTSRQLSMSSVTNSCTCWYFCATPDCTSENRKKGKYSYMHNEQLHANSPPPPIPLSRRYFFIFGTYQQINQCPPPF